MTDLMRDTFKKVILDTEAFQQKDYENVFNEIESAHAGLLMQRGLPVWEDGEKPCKKELINKISSVKADDLYLLAFKRWLYQTYNPKDEQINPNFAHVSANLTHRMYTELSAGNTLETGASTHHTYGMPMLAGSAIKGAVRSYTENLFEKNNQPNKENILNILFGSGDEETDSDNAGYIIWHDAWWIPNEVNKPFVSEIVTVHHQQYYDGKLDEALDMESPTPNQQIAIQGGFYFTLQGDDKWVNFAKELLVAVLKNQGMGAKGSSGYGYFELDSKQIDEIMKKKLKADKETADRIRAEKEQAEFEEMIADKSPLEQELEILIKKHDWNVKGKSIRTHFINNMDIWISKLEENPSDKGVIMRFVEITKIHIDWKKPSSKQRGRINRLKEMQRKLQTD